MSTKFYLTDGGEIPTDLANPDGLTKFKEIVTLIRESLNDKGGTSTSSILLKQLENVQEVNSLTAQLFAWKDTNELAIADYGTAFNAIENMLERLEDSELKFLQMTTTSEGVIDVKIVHPGTIATTEETMDVSTEPPTDENANDNDISAATDEVVRDDIKKVVSDTYLRVAQGRAEINALGENPIADMLEDTTTIRGTDDDWTTPTRGVSRAKPSETGDNQNSTTQKSENTYGSLYVEYEPDDDGDKYDEFEGSRGMEQSIDDEAQSEEDKKTPPKTTKSEKQKLLDRKDLNYRNNGGWNRINRIVQKGDTSLISIEDLAYFINRAPKAMKQAKTEQFAFFDAGVQTRTISAESKLRKSCETIVDTALTTLNKEDGMVFNKIRLNRTQLDKEITTSKEQIAKQIKVNETSHAIVADLETRLGNHGKLQRICENLVTKMENLEKTNKDLTQRLIKLETESASATPSVATFELGDDETSKANIQDLKDAVPDGVPSKRIPKEESTNPFEKQTEKTIPYGSRVILKSGIMKATTAYIMNVTQTDGRNLYQAQTGGHTNIFVRREEILEVEQEGDANMFRYGYDPTRSMAVFQQHVDSLKSSHNTPKRKKSTGHHTTPRFSSVTKNNTDGSIKQRRYPFASVNPIDVDDDDLDDEGYFRPLAEYEYIYPAGTAPKKIAEDKIEQVHENLRVNLSDESKIQGFYEDLRRRLKSLNIPLRDWNSLKPGIDILDLPANECQNYNQVKVVMSRAIFNLLDANKETLITDMYMKGELDMYDKASDGFGFLNFMVSQIHPNFRHELSQPSIAATLEPPKFRDTATLYEFCKDIQDYISEGRAPNHFTPLAAAQFVAEALRVDTRFNKGRIALEQEIATVNNSTGFVPEKLSIQRLPRLILSVYEPSMKRILSKAKREGVIFNATRMEFCHPVGDPNFYPEDSEDMDLTINRVNTRSMNRERSQGPSPKPYQKKPYDNQQSGDRRSYKNYSNDRNNSTIPDIAFIQCTACGGPGHIWKNCTMKDKFIRLNEWYAQLSPSQRKEMSVQLDKNARATHERYKQAYAKRREVRKRINKASVESNQREVLLSAYRSQIDDLDYGTLDPDLVDEDEPFLSFDPEVEKLDQ